jgi:predicted DNA-binding transcriptional regulator YafY
MYHPSTRLLTILELLQTRPVLSGDDLAQRLEVAPRTIRRYITMLQDLGMPIETVRGPGGGYRLRPGFTLPPLVFHEDEAAALVVGLLGIAAQRVDAAVPIAGALAKVLRVLPRGGREAVQAVAANLSFAPEQHGHRLDLAPLLQLSAAAEQRQRVALTYQGGSAQETQRTVEPYGLASWWGEWYLVGYCCLRQAIRTFRLDRVRAIETLSETFVRPDDFDGQAYLRRQLGEAGGHYRVVVTFDAALEEMQRRIPADYGSLTSTPEGTRFEARHGNLRSVALFVIGLDRPFVVHEPPELLALLRQLAQQILGGLPDQERAAETLG